MSPEDEALAAARAVQARWDAAALVRAYMSGGDDEAGRVVERPGWDPALAAVLLAGLTARILTASAELREKIHANPDKMLGDWGRFYGPELRERVPRELLPPGPRLPGDTMRDAVALIEAVNSSASHDELQAILSSADQVGLLFYLARICSDLAHEVYGADLAGWLGAHRAVAERLDQDG